NISPKSNELVYLKNGQLWRVPIDGSASAKRLFTDKGNVQHAQWSPSGDQIVFSSSRTTHSFIGVWSRYKKAIQWIAPAFSNDIQPKWSPDERSIAFVRLPGKTNEKFSILERRHQPWEIQVADLESGESRLLWKAPTTLAGSIPTK